MQSDEVPVADAAEQQRAIIEQVADQEAPVESADSAPLEAPTPDWQEQLQAVEPNPELDELDRDR